jgi:hypothetical protein
LVRPCGGAIGIVCSPDSHEVSSNPNGSVLWQAPSAHVWPRIVDLRTGASASESEVIPMLPNPWRSWKIARKISPKFGRQVFPL